MRNPNQLARVEIGPFDPTVLEPKSAPVTLKGRKLQVICKLANIELTPEKPDYTGGSWHVEGMQNEVCVFVFVTRSALTHEFASVHRRHGHLLLQH